MDCGVDVAIVMWSDEGVGVVGYAAQEGEMRVEDQVVRG